MITGCTPTAPSATPTQVSAGLAACALTTTGTVRCWGAAGPQEHLQNGDIDFDFVPREIAGISGAKQVSAGGSFKCALEGAGSVVCWGDNQAGQLGSGVEVTNSESLKPSPTPIKVAGLGGMVQIATGDDFACARSAAGEIYCWGDNAYGELGDSVDLSSKLDDYSTVAKKVPGITGATWLAAHGEQACVVINGGITCWGHGASTPSVQRGFESGFDKVAIGLSRGFAPSFICGLTTEGAVTCAGGVATGSAILGRGSDMTDPSTAQQVRGLSSGVTAVSIGEYVACVIQSGTVKCWGENEDTGGESFGVETPSSTSVPIDVPGLSNVTSLSVGQCAVCVVADAKASCWGWHPCVGDDFRDRSGSEQAPPTRVLSLP